MYIKWAFCLLFEIFTVAMFYLKRTTQYPHRAVGCCSQHVFRPSCFFAEKIIFLGSLFWHKRHFYSYLLEPIYSYWKIIRISYGNICSKMYRSFRNLVLYFAICGRCHACWWRFCGVWMLVVCEMLFWLDWGAGVIAICIHTQHTQHTSIQHTT